MHKKTLFTPIYWLSKFNLSIFKRRFPEAPWLTQAAVYLLHSWLKESDTGLEWGSGRSTTWFASRIRYIISIEYNEYWFGKVSSRIRELNLSSKTDLRYIPIRKEIPDDLQPYVMFINTIPEASLDFALIDGHLRFQCMQLVISKIKPGGLLILDDAQRFVPNAIMDNHSTSINKCDIFPDSEWKTLIGSLDSWRSIHTSDGVTDTRFWVKPFE